MSGKKLGDSIPAKMTKSYNKVSSVADDSDDSSLKKVNISNKQGLVLN